eukprot:GFYU01000034.1.p1 GENE.GFYU01000034.1~~GFYU01000034.1.p1  ORF type:complete len:227 (+),score=66.07 GFYU01000034.1:421-1101(+)
MTTTSVLHPTGALRVESYDEVPEIIRSKTAVIFDWDDTLIPSTFLSISGIRLDQPLCLSPELTAQLEELDDAVYNVLCQALSLGHVFIITNAEHGWVQLSAYQFLPKVSTIINKCRVLSARSQYEEYFPDSPAEWKVRAFAESLEDTFSNLSELNLISFGDGEFERNAVIVVGRNLESARTKSIKFVDKPSLDQLQRQVELIQNHLPTIAEHDGDLDLMLTINLLG